MNSNRIALSADELIRKVHARIDESYRLERQGFIHMARTELRIAREQLRMVSVRRRLESVR